MLRELTLLHPSLLHENQECPCLENSRPCPSILYPNIELVHTFYDDQLPSHLQGEAIRFESTKAIYNVLLELQNPRILLLSTHASLQFVTIVYASEHYLLSLVSYYHFVCTAHSRRPGLKYTTHGFTSLSQGRLAQIHNHIELQQHAANQLMIDHTLLCGSVVCHQVISCSATSICSSVACRHDDPASLLIHALLLMLGMSRLFPCLSWIITLLSHHLGFTFRSVLQPFDSIQLAGLASALQPSLGNLYSDLQQRPT